MTLSVGEKRPRMGGSPVTMHAAHADAYQPHVHTVLLVDGDADTRMLYRTLFEPFADAFVEAEDGAEALGMAIQERPGLVVTETRLRRVDGFALCSLLRRDPATHDIPIMVITSAASVSDRLRAASAGADAVLVKPCGLDDMLATLRRLCEQPREQPPQAAPPEPQPPSGDGHAPQRRSIKSRSYERRFTTTPPNAPPHAFCPACATALVYVNSHVGGVNEDHAEQWDYFTCATCGTFRYRHRTRKLTPTSDQADAAPMR